MKWFTDIKIPPADYSLEHDDRILLIGSCFSDNITAKLQNAGVQSMGNPFGVVYNPYSILNQIKQITMASDDWVDAVVEHQELYKSLLHHSSFNRLHKENLLQEIKEAEVKSREFLKKANLVVVSFGTAWVYEHESKGLVANCQKLSQKHFKKSLLSIDRVVDILQEICESLKAFNPSVKLLFTLSPVRHLKDGMIENARSKAILLESIHRVCAQNDFSSYFPSNEIQLDVLRDYRFYASDLVHPSEDAVGFIWDKFKSFLFSEEAKTTMVQVESIRRSLAHNSFNPEAESSIDFRKSLEKDIADLKEKCPYVEL